jgi:FkbM family methyltransferase
MNYILTIKKENLKFLFRNLMGKIKFVTGIIYAYKNRVFVLLNTLGILKRKIMIYRMKNGINYLARNCDISVINDMYVNKQYHKFINKIQNNSIVIDVGAHIGVFSLLATTLGKNVRVYSYEPFEENFKILKRNIHLNILHNIHPFKLAVSRKKGKRILFINKNPAGNSFFVKKGEKVMVDTITLKDVLDSNNIASCDLLKMDCEGAEYEILFSTPKNYIKKIKNICLEYHNNYDVKKLKIFLENNGFSVILDKKKAPIIFVKGENFPSLFAERENSLLFAEKL